MCKELPHPSFVIVNGDADSIEDNSKELNAAYRRRLLILGGAGSGKSSIVKSLCSGSAQISGKPTDGIAIQLLCPFTDLSYHNLVDHKLGDEDRSLVLEIWDGSGRQLWQQCQLLFLLQQSVCVIVFNIMDQSSCHSVAQNVQFIQAKAPRSQVIIVGTHVDRLSDEDQQERCKEILEDIQKRCQHRREEVERELDVIKDTPGKKCHKVKHKQRQLKEILDKFQNPSRIHTTSNVTLKGLDDIKKTILETVLHHTHQTNGIRTNAKQTLSHHYQQIISLRRENNVIVTKDTLCSVSKRNDEMEIKSVDDNTDENVQLKCSKNKPLEYLQSVGAIIEVKLCNKMSLSSSQNSGDISSKETITTPSPSSSEECSSPKSAPANTEDQRPALLCINPAALAQAIFAVHVDNTKKSFKFEANRFWPKTEGAKKPNPEILVHALEEIATKGLIRECLFPLLWQNLNLTESQTQFLIDFLCSLGILVQEILPAFGEPDCQCLQLPHYSNLSTQQQYRLPLLGLLIEHGPSLNWTVKPFQGDIEITWRYEFLGSEMPPGMVTRMLAFCHNHGPSKAAYQHYWTNGVLMKIGQVYIHMSQPTDTTQHYINFTGRITMDEEGEHKATEFLWVALSQFLICSQQYLREWPGLEYKVTLLPSKAYYECSNSKLDSIEVPLLLCLQMLEQDQSTLHVLSGDTHCEVRLNTLLPLTGDPKLSVEEWLQWLSVQPVVWQEHDPSPENPVIDEETATDGGDESSLTASPKIDTSNASNVSQDKGTSSLTPAKDKVVAKKKEIKWDLGGTQITEEQQIREAKKVAATFIAAVMAGAMAQYIVEEFKGPYAEAVAMASAQAAKAAQSGDPVAAARAVVAAVQAVSNSPGGKVTRSRMCAIV